MNVIKYDGGRYDVIVVGAGHAGCEAALAAARMGKKTLLLTMNLDSVAFMPCNPSIGGTAKGHLVKEVDALGGEMGVNTDKTFIQSRMLNASKGPAVHSLRAQADKHRYQDEMKLTIEKEENIDLKQREVISLVIENKKVTGVVTKTGATFKADAVVLATGTYLKGKIYIGEVNYYSGANDMAPAMFLTDSLTKEGIVTRRFKTGTPARVHRDSIDYSKLQVHEGDKEIIPFSFLNDEIDIEQKDCYMTYTNQKTHEVILSNLDRSPIYSGTIESAGPRYCPSIEDKVMRFSDKPRHQIFIEPEGLNTKEMYVQGMSSSLPSEVQLNMLRTIEGLENVEIMREAYAIEYDCINPMDLKLNLESRIVENLFFAGQVNGSSGYEEAAAQGIMAGINAVLKIDNKEPFIIDRSEGYIGVLIDDLVTKGTNEPYRMMTSRAEYRLTLRQDNADLRLTEKAYKIGLATKDRYDKMLLKKKNVEDEIQRLGELKVTPKKKTQEFMESIGTSPLSKAVTMEELVRRPELKYDDLASIDPDRPKLNRDTRRQIEIQIKYDGYIGKQEAQIRQFKRIESKKLPEDIDYNEIKTLRLEARQKLSQIRPVSIGQASRISGVSPADINVLLIYLEQQRRKDKEQS